MMNVFLLRCTLLSVRIAYFLLPILKWICKIMFWGLIAFVIILLLFLVF